ncbi:MAG: sulfurtransferase [Chloroflexi bacterium]|nr:sulfurtransferase [Chloroflexota bacterium]
MADSSEHVLVSTEWVAAHLNDPRIAIAEVDSHPDDTYAVGHIPGAVSWGLHTDFEDRIRRDIPTPQGLSVLLSKSGVDRNTTLILYGDGHNRSATWAFWVLKYYGHPDVRIMDGGRYKWETENRPFSKDVPKRQPTSYGVSNPDHSLRALREHILGRLGNASTKLLDTRALEEYTGQLTAAPGGHQPDIYRKGRIPGAIHIPWDDAEAKDGSFKPVEELRKLYASKDLTTEDEIITYCRLGVRASYSWFVLKYLLGYKDVKNYDGSWTEWGNAIGVPIETDQP